MHERANWSPQSVCSLRCSRRSWQFPLEQPHCKHASEHSGWKTHPTGMDLVDHILVTIHGRGNHQWCTTRADLCHPHASTAYLPMVRISPQDHRHSTLWMLRVASTSPPNLTIPHKALQEETLHEITLVGKHSICTSRNIHTFTCGAHLPPTSSHHCLQGWLSSQAFP